MKRRSLAGLEAVSRAAKFQTSIKDFFFFVALILNKNRQNTE